MDRDEDILLERRGRCGLVTLNRPKALNALTYDMVDKMEPAYIEWGADANVYGIVLQSSGGRAFCAGGDLKALYDMWKGGKLDTTLKRYTCEYQHNWTLDRFLKPHVALMDGFVFGSGVGISLYGTHKAAGENYSFAMPEAGIGFFPDVGGTHFLSRMPGQIGLYLALTGRQIGRADAYALGLLTHCIDAAEFGSICEAMSEADPIDPVLDSRHKDPGPSAILEIQETIDRHLSGETVEEILASLDAAEGQDAEWARETAAEIRKASPFSLKVAFHQVRNTGKPSLEEALALDARIARIFLQREEFYEGIRALLIDKDGKPKWSTATLAEVSDDEVDACFAAENSDFRPINPFA